MVTGGRGGLPARRPQLPSSRLRQLNLRSKNRYDNRWWTGATMWRPEMACPVPRASDRSRTTNAAFHDFASRAAPTPTDHRNHASDQPLPSDRPPHVPRRFRRLGRRNLQARVSGPMTVISDLWVAGPVGGNWNARGIWLDQSNGVTVRACWVLALATGIQVDGNSNTRPSPTTSSPQRPRTRSRTPTIAPCGSKTIATTAKPP